MGVGGISEMSMGEAESLGAVVARWRMGLEALLAGGELILILCFFSYTLLRMAGRRTLATELRWARARLERRAGRRARVNDDDMISERR